MNRNVVFSVVIITNKSNKLRNKKQFAEIEMISKVKPTRLTSCQKIEKITI